MSNDISRLIQQAWREQQIPIIDGVLFSTGALYPVSYYQVTSGGVSGVGARVCEHTPLLVQMSEDLATVDELAAESDLVGGVRYSCGEGSAGGDGFLACTLLTTGDLEWVAFFQQSNPFVRLAIVDGQIEVVNNHGHIWRFRKTNPLEIDIC